jgi:hypothetical protein
MHAPRARIPRGGGGTYQHKDPQMADPTYDYHQLYRSDFVLWAQAVAQALRQDALDAQARQIVAEQIAALGQDKAHGSTSLLGNLLLHLMQFSHDICSVSHHHDECIRTLRHQLATLLAHSPSLTSLLHTELEGIYQQGVQHYLHALDRGHYLPVTCPFTLAQLLDPDFLPT